MHGIVEAITVLVFLGTLMGAFIVRLLNPPRPAPTILLIGLWPLAYGLFSEGRRAILEPGQPELWLAGTAISLTAALVGGLAASGLMRLLRRSS